MTQIMVAFRNFADAPKKQRRKSEVVPVHNMKAYRRSKNIAPFILNLGTRWRLAVNFMTLPRNSRVPWADAGTTSPLRP
jgi:hypothetical protein